MNCNAFRMSYEAYISDELSAGMAAQFEEHVGECAACREWFEMQQIAGEALRLTAEDSLPPEHYFEGLFQRVAPRLTRVNRREQIRQILLAPFTAILFSNRIPLRLARAAALCAFGAGLALALSGNDLPELKFGKKAPAVAFQSQKSLEQGTVAEAASSKRDPVNDMERLWSGFSDLMQQAITPKMKDPKLEVEVPKHSETIFEQMDLLKFSLVREGDLPQLARVVKMEQGLMAVGQITEAESKIARQQCQLVEKALELRLQNQHAQMEEALQLAVQLNMQSRWACYAKYLLANLYEAQGHSGLAVSLYRDCMTNYPLDCLNAKQVDYARDRVAKHSQSFFDKFLGR